MFQQYAHNREDFGDRAYTQPVTSKVNMSV